MKENVSLIQEINSLRKEYHQLELQILSLTSDPLKQARYENDLLQNEMN